MNSREKEGTTNKISLFLDLNVKDGNNFCFETLFVDPCLFIAIQLLLELKTLFLIFFQNLRF